MSITTYLLLIIFLCIPLHACNARHLSTIDKKLEKKSNSSIKISYDEQKGFDSTPKRLNESKDDDKMKKTRLVANNHSEEKPSKNRRTRRSMVKAMIGKAVSSSSGALQTESSLVSVSWRVPHKKPREKNNPGFNLDYSPPKTHPPSHN